MCMYMYVIFCYKISICDFYNTHFMNGRQTLEYYKLERYKILNLLTVT